MATAPSGSLSTPAQASANAAMGRGWLRLVDRMMLGELRGPVLSGIGMFALLTVFAVVLQETLRFQIKWGLSTGTMLTMLVLAAPQFVVLAIPMGSLLGTMLAIARLNNDHEIVALRASGINLFRILMPLLVVGLLLSAITFWGNEWLVPASLSRLTTLKNSIISGSNGQIHRERFVAPLYLDGELRWVLLADEINGEELTGVQLLYFDPKDDVNDTYLKAARAQWVGNSWDFYDARTVRLQEAENPDEQQRVILHTGTVHVPDFNFTPKNLGLKARTTDEMTSRDLQASIEEALKSGEVERTPVIRELRTKLYFKHSIPLTPLLFMLVAFPLAVRSTRTTTGVGFGMALLLVLVYYAAYSTCLRMGTAGVLPPLLAAWTPDIALAATGLALVNRRQHS